VCARRSLRRRHSLKDNLSIILNRDWQTWPNDIKQAIEEICKSIVEDHGYASSRSKVKDKYIQSIVIFIKGQFD
jgi:hypothetical protein